MEERKKYFKMPKDKLDAWIKALRSGKFKQGTEGHLYNSNEVSYCCLGVLGHICGITESDMDEEPYVEKGATWDGHENYPKELKYGGSDNDTVSVYELTILLSRLNDGIDYHTFEKTPLDLVWPKIPDHKKPDEYMKYNFNEIAQFLEDNVEGYGETYTEKEDTPKPTWKEVEKTRLETEKEYSEKLRLKVRELEESSKQLNKVLDQKDDEVEILKKQLAYERDAHQRLREDYLLVQEKRNNYSYVIHTIHRRMVTHQSRFGNRKLLNKLVEDINHFLKNN